MASTKKKKTKAPPKPVSTVAAVRQGKSGEKRRGDLWENIKGIVGAVLLFLFLRTFLVEAYRIPSRSMVPSAARR